MLERLARADRPLLWVLAVYLGAVALHIDRLPVWCTAAIVLIAVWRALAAISALGMPRNIVRVALGTALLVAVLAQFSTISGLAAGTALLAAMGAVKLLETRNRRDHYIVLGVSLFLMLAACLDRQSLLRVPLYVAHTWLACAALCVVAAPTLRIAPRLAFKQAGRALAYALPVALLLFVFFPRFQGQIWSLPGAGSAVTGLSNEMSPGAISQLSESDVPAFRVTFLGARPPSTSLYWRGPVLHEFDGYTWRRQPGRISTRPALQYGGDEFRYRVTLEPHQRNWWFALDMPRRPPRSNVFFTFDYQLLAAQPVTQTVTYELTSHVQYRSTEPISFLSRRMGLQLPEGRNPRSLAWARRERAAAGSDQAFVERVLSRFRDEGFVYSLTPPRLDLNSVDDFLFNTRSGFCGHYASAFVTLMRAAGIPARVVTGYHGGEWNPIGEYLIVRQSDAHAWAEIWVPGKGWTRVDPTGVVAPDRLRRAALDGLGLSAAARDVLVADLGWWPRAVLTWDAANTWWKTRVLDFDLRSQLSLMQRLGFDAPGLRELGWMLAGALALWLAIVGLRFSRRPAPPPVDPLARSYRRLCRSIAAAGIARAPDEGPLDFSRRLAHQRPALAAVVAPLLTDYASLRFGANPADAAIRAFDRAVRRMRLPKQDVSNAA
jgi:transglutaminase-like putative cysteine protease